MSTLDQTLAERYDAGLFDLDGVCYLGNEAIEHAPEEVARAVASGLRHVYVTNNASRTTDDVARHLASLGFPAVAADVVTSAQVGADIAAKRCGEEAKILVIGGAGLIGAVEERGLKIVRSADDGPDAVLQGFFQDVTWHDLSEAALAIRAGALYIATNLDLVIPRERGLMVGNGALVGAVSLSTGVKPISGGKPEPEIFLAAARGLDSRKPLAIGDNLDTDIKGAVSAGIDCLHVLTGLASARNICLAPPEVRPTFLCDDMRGLNEPYPEVLVETGDEHSRQTGDERIDDGEDIGSGDVAKAGTVTVGSAQARWTESGVRLFGEKEIDVAAGPTLNLDEYRALVHAAWKAADAGADLDAAVGEITVVR